MRDLQNSAWMYFKALGFLVIGVVSATLLLLDNRKLQTALLLILTTWAMCRAYYFAFYVIEKYVDSQFKFSGILDFCLYLLRHRYAKKPL